MDNKKIGEFIYSRRKELGLTQQELADKIKITNKAVSKWENGDGLPEISSIPILATELKVSTDELLSGRINSDQNIKTVATPELASCIIKERKPDIKKVVLAIATCSIASFYIISAFSLIVHYLILFFTQEWYRPSGLFAAGFGCVDGAFWSCILIITTCFLLKQFGYKTNIEKNSSIVALILGIVLIFMTGSGYLQTDYQLFYLVFGICVILSACHGYRTAYKIFLGLSIVVLVLGIGLKAYNLVDANQETLQYMMAPLSTNALLSISFLVLYGITVKNAYYND